MARSAPEHDVGNLFGQLRGIGCVVVTQTNDREALFGNSQQLALEADERAAVADRLESTLLANHQTKTIAQDTTVVQLALTQQTAGEVLATEGPVLQGLIPAVKIFNRRHQAAVAHAVKLRQIISELAFLAGKIALGAVLHQPRAAVVKA